MAEWGGGGGRSGGGGGVERVNHSWQAAYIFLKKYRSVRVAEWLAFPTSDHAVLGSNLTGDVIQLMTVWRFIAQSLSLSSFHRLDMS